MTKVFLSYSRSDSDLVSSIGDLLTEIGFDVWWDKRILPGERWLEEISRNLEESDWVLAFYTQNSIKSDWINKEVLRISFSLPDKLIPLRFDNCEIPLLIDDIQCAELDRADPKRGDGWGKLIESLRRQPPKSRGNDLDKGSRPIPVAPEVKLSDVVSLPPPELPSEEAVTEEPESDAVPYIDFEFQARELSIADSAYLLRKALKHLALGTIRAAARSGQAEAQMLMGIAASEGIEIERNLDDAGRWLRLAAEQDHPRAMAEYAWHLGQVLRTSNSQDAVVEASSRALDAGTTRGRTVYATNRLDGFQVGVDEKRAVELLSASAREGDMLAATVLGWALTVGRGIRRDYGAGARWLKDAAEHGNALAQANYGRLLVLGRGVVFDAVRAAYWFERSAKQGHVWGQFFFAWSYENGAGITRDLTEARLWYGRSAEQGDVDAQVALARLCLAGLGGARDVEKARHYLDQAADREDPRALALLGELYENGVGVGVDLNKAIAFYRKAADQNEPRAALNLGLMYDWGRGLERSVDQARHYLAIAAGQYGDTKARIAAERKLDFIGR